MVNFKATQTSILVKDGLNNSVRDLGTSYNDSSKLKCMYLLGVCECERIEILLFIEMAVMGINSDGTRVEYQVL